MFSGIWKVAKGFLDERTRSKIEVKGGNYYKTLLQYAEEEDIPEFLGGKCTIPFPADVGPWNDYEIVDNKFKKKGSEEAPPAQIEAMGFEETKESPLARSKTKLKDVSHSMRSNVSVNDENDYTDVRTAAGTIYYDCVEDGNEIEDHAIQTLNAATEDIKT